VAPCDSLTNSDPLLIGSNITGLVSTGIDEVGIFNRVLGPTEILDIFQAGSAGKCKPVINFTGAQFCIFGPSTGVGWTWTLGGSGPFSVPPVAAGSTAIQLAAAWVANMTLNGVTATQLTGSQANCFTISQSQTLTVDGCTVTGNPNGCSFNPTVIELVGGGPRIPTVSQWGLAILALLLLVGAKVYFDRRYAGIPNEAET